MTFRELTNEEFINFTNNWSFKSIFQTPEYGFIMNKQGFESYLLGLLENDQIVGATLVLIRKENGFKYAYAPRGYLLDYGNYKLLNDFSKQIKKYLSKKGVIGIKMNPMIVKNIHKFPDYQAIENPNYDYLYNQLVLCNYYHLGYNNFFEALNPRFEAVIDLDKPINVLFNNIKKEFKTKIRTCYKNGIRVYKGNINVMDEIEIFTNKKYDFTNEYYVDCYDFYSKRNMVDLYYTELDTQVYLKNIQEKLNYYEAKSGELSDEIMKKSKSNPTALIKKKINVDRYLNQYQNDLVTATAMLRDYPNGAITSAVLVIKQDKEATILIDGYDKQFKKLNSKHLLIWQLIETYKKEGFTRFNLGGITSIKEDSKYSGVTEFKLNFGADIYEYAGDFELIANRPNYELYRNFYPIRKLIKYDE